MLLLVSELPLLVALLLTLLELLLLLLLLLTALLLTELDDTSSQLCVIFTCTV